VKAKVKQEHDFGQLMFLKNFINLCKRSFSYCFYNKVIFYIPNNKLVERTKKKKTPFGIIIISILTVISGLILFAMSFVSLMILSPSGPLRLMGSMFLLILGTASIIVSFGLYKGKGWSWTLLLILSGFGAAGYLLNIVNGQSFSVIGLVINAIIIYYLYKPHIRKFFGK
jgi:hypothetical protein